MKSWKFRAPRRRGRSCVFTWGASKTSWKSMMSWEDLPTHRPSPRSLRAGCRSRPEAAPTRKMTWYRVGPSSMAFATVGMVADVLAPVGSACHMGPIASPFPRSLSILSLPSLLTPAPPPDCPFPALLRTLQSGVRSAESQPFQCRSCMEVSVGIQMHKVFEVCSVAWCTSVGMRLHCSLWHQNGQSL